MDNKMRKKMTFAGLMMLIILIIAFAYINSTSKEDNLYNKDNTLNLDKETKSIFEEYANNLSAWVVYWDLNSSKEIKTLSSGLKNVCYFGANFNSNNELVIPQKLINYHNETKDYIYNKYITIVNDKINSDGKSLLKDTNLLKALLSDSSLKSKHVEDVINLAAKHGFDGIEIDYEQIKNNMKLWEDYILFIKELYEKCEKQGLKLRIVLEPNIPVDKLNFPEGPNYVIMCYNLHGPFSEPGEKANPKFIQELIGKMKKIPGKKEFAIANGGFNWASNGKTTSLSEAEANHILKEYKAKVERDAESQCLFFNYKDENNIEHEVWYADKTTLKSWMQVITEKGHDISIWKVPGTGERRKQ